MVTVAQHKVCKPIREGGLGIRSLISLNEASNLKLCWELHNSSESWADILKSRVLKGRNFIRYHIYSSLWSSIKAENEVVLQNSSWNLGNGTLINFWRDNWCGQPLADSFNLPTFIADNLQAKVCDFIQDYHWNIPDSVSVIFPAIKQLVKQVTIPKFCAEDKRIWTSNISGILSFKDAFLHKTPAAQQFHWAKTIWSPDIPPSKSMLAWRLMHDRLPTDEHLMNRGFSIASICNTSAKAPESTFHLFFQCPIAVKIWCWFAGLLKTTFQFSFPLLKTFGKYVIEIGLHNANW